MEIVQLLEVVGSATGILGALTMALKAKTHAHLAWSFWLISSLSLFVMSFQSGLYSLMSMQVVFFVINIIGLKNSIKDLRTVQIHQ